MKEEKKKHRTLRYWEVFSRHKSAEVIYSGAKNWKGCCLPTAPFAKKVLLAFQSPKEIYI